MSRLFPFLLLLPLLLSCQSGDDQAAMQAADEAAIKGFVVSLNAGLREAYVGAPINIDSLFAVSFDSGAYTADVLIAGGHKSRWTRRGSG